MVIIVATVMVVMVVVVNMVVIVFRTGQDKLTFKLHFPGNLFRAASAILVMLNTKRGIEIIMKCKYCEFQIILEPKCLDLGRRGQNQLLFASIVQPESSFGELNPGMTPNLPLI